MSQDSCPRSRAPSESSAGGLGPATENWIDDELAQSFPASDPPSWTMGGEQPCGDPAAAPARRIP